jgi:RimJ/RimL family protein N-acetyltransferase
MAEPIVLPDPPLGDGVVTLRPWRDADVVPITAACQAPDISRYTTVPSPYTEADAAAFIARSHDELAAGEGVHLAVVAADDDHRVLGAIGMDLGGSVATVGYWVAPDARHLGAASRALRLVTPWAFEALGLSVVLAEIRVGNEASVHVARAAGYEQTGAIDLPETPENPDILLFARRSG